MSRAASPPLARALALALAAAGAASCAHHPSSAPAARDAGAAHAGLVYPRAQRDDVVDVYHGIRVPDPYRWLEKIDSPATRAWVAAEDRLSSRFFAAIPARARIAARLKALLSFERFSAPFHEGTRYFYAHNTGLQGQSVLETTLGLDGTPRVALDPNALSKDGSLAVVGYAASRDGRLLAYGVSVGGSDWTDWHVRDLATGKDLPDVIRWTKYYAPAFATGGKGLYYSAFPAPPPGHAAALAAPDRGDAVYYHALGTPQSADRAIYARPDHPSWQFEPHLTHDGRWLVILAGDGEVGDKGRENVYLVDLASGARAVVPMVEGFDAEYLYAGADGGLLYFQTTLDAPNGRVIAVDPAHPARARWKNVVPAGPDALDLAWGSVHVVGHRLFCGYLHDAHSRVVSYRLDGSDAREVALPGAGTAAGFAGEPDDAETFYTFTNLITPPTIYRYDIATGASTVYRAPKVPFDPSDLATTQVFYRSKDGTRIPMYLAYRKGLRRDGENPTLLYGYGGFGISILPTFTPARLLWLELGGVYAIANIRGGGEYGEAWHRAGILTHKQVVFDDFIAAAEYLIAQRYTSTPKLAIMGGSNGGLLIGACLTQRPDLFGAALAYVGVMDMLRFDQFGQGAGWEGDYGSPGDPADFKALLAYSPYQNVRPGTRYPPTLITTGDHDTRVFPAHSYKFAAALQAAQAGPAPILLRVETSSGHGGGPTTTQEIAQTADAYAFLEKVLGMETAAP